MSPVEGRAERPRSRRGRRGRSGPRRSSAPARSTSAGERVRVRVADRARSQRLARLLQLVAGGQHGDPRTEPAADLGPPDRGQHPDAGGVELGADHDHRPPRLDVLAGAADVLAGRHLDRDRDRLGAAVGVLDPDHRVGSLGDHRAGRDRDRLTGAESARRRVPGPRLADHRQPGRLRARGAGRVGGADRVAVHRRVVEARHRVGAGDVLGQDATERIADGDRLRLERAGALEHQRSRPLDLDRLAHRLVGEAISVGDWVRETPGDRRRCTCWRAQPPHGGAEGDGGARQPPAGRARRRHRRLGRARPGRGREARLAAAEARLPGALASRRSRIIPSPAWSPR